MTHVVFLREGNTKPRVSEINEVNLEQIILLVISGTLHTRRDCVALGGRPYRYKPLCVLIFSNHPRK